MAESYETESYLDNIVQMAPLDISTPAKLVTAMRSRTQLVGMVGLQKAFEATAGFISKAEQDGVEHDFNDTVKEIRKAMLEVFGVNREDFTRKLNYIRGLEKQKTRDLTAAGYLLSANGHVKPNLANAVRLLTIAADKLGHYALNEFAQEITNTNTGANVTEDYYLDLTVQMQLMGNYDFKPHVVTDAVIVVAHRNKFHPVRQYLTDLQWDGVSRLWTAGAQYWGTTTHIENVFIAKFLLGAAARILQPGCKVDTYPVFEGKQGSLKSTSLNTLVGDAWFVDHLPDLHNKDVYLQLSGKWIIEMAELDAMRRAEHATMKKFVSTRIDKYRPPYARTAIEVPRQSVLAGSVNETEYLTDNTGNRRTHPITCGNINIDALARDKDQLWAETCAVLQGKVPGMSGQWWLTKDEEAVQKLIVGERMEHNELDGLVTAWLEGAMYMPGYGLQLGHGRVRTGTWDDRFMLSEIATGLGWDAAKMNRAQQMALGNALRVHGYVSVPDGGKRYWAKKGG